MSEAVDRLAARFQTIFDERMQGLPLVNEALSVETVGFRPVCGHELGVLLTPWFMNLVLLPGTDDWQALPNGEPVDVLLPSGEYEFTVTRDEEIGTFLSAILFRTVADFPSQEVARSIAGEIAVSVRLAPDDEDDDDGEKSKTVSRRELFTSLGAS